MLAKVVLFYIRILLIKLYKLSFSLVFIINQLYLAGLNLKKQIYARFVIFLKFFLVYLTQRLEIPITISSRAKVDKAKIPTSVEAKKTVNFFSLTTLAKLCKKFF